jgi:hypothetical protein
VPWSEKRATTRLKLDKLSKQPRLPIRIEPPHPGRPKGRIDSPRHNPRQRTIGWSHREDLELETARLVDRDWDG